MILSITRRLALIPVVLGLSACMPDVPLYTACPASVGGNPAAHVVGADGGDMAWPGWGRDLANSQHAAGEVLISPANVADLEVKWIARTTGSVSATPTVTDDRLYLTDWGPDDGGDARWPGGSVFALDAADGSKVWSKRIQQLNGDKLNQVSRSSPAIFEDMIIIADVQNAAPITVMPSLIDRARRFLFGFGDICGGYVYGINRHSGELVWSTRIGEGLFDQVSQSPVVYNGKVLVGLSSHESTYTRSAKVPCCSFRGSLVALDAHTGAIEWRHYMVEDVAGYAGAAVWAGKPTVDPARNLVYVPTGNNYSLPASVLSCVRSAVDDAARLACTTSVQNDFDAIVALDLDSGARQWAMHSRPYDAWTTACDYEHLFPLLSFSSSRKHCPNPKGPDSDFAQPPVLVSVEVSPGVFEDRLFAGNKSGEFFAINPDDGAVIWRRQVGPGGLIGGMQFGAASDGQRIYIQNTNFDHRPYTLEAGVLAGTTIVSGFWAALNPVNGDILWQTPVPNYDAPVRGDYLQLTGDGGINDDSAQLGLQFGYGSGGFHPVWGFGLGEGFFNWPMGGLVVANGVVFAGVANLQGTMVAMDAASGVIRWRYDSGQSVVSTPSVVNGRVYWGSGYKTGTQGNRVYSFGLP